MKNMAVSGIPSWVQMYFEKLHQGGKPVGEIFKILICLFMAV
jgi:hypothetical protein